MKVVRIIFNPLLFFVIASLCFYFLFSASFKSLRMEKIITSTDFNLFASLYDNLDDEAKTFIDYKTFQELASGYTLDILNGRRIDSSRITNIIDSKLEIILNNPLVDEQTKQQIKNEAHAEAKKITDSIEKVSKSEEVNLIRTMYSVFSSNTMTTALVLFIVTGAILFALNPKFKWLKYISVITGFMTILYFVLFLIINKILSLAASSEIMNIITYCFNLLFKASFNVCIYFMIAVFIVLIIYKFLLLPNINKKA